MDLIALYLLALVQMTAAGIQVFFLMYYDLDFSFLVIIFH